MGLNKTMNKADKMKKFIITIDTEGDNLWGWKEGNEITTKNVYYLDRFQNLCNQYGFKPVYLSNWEIVQNDDFVCWVKGALAQKTCELGMHLHAWNTPPLISLPKWDKSGKPYLIEYSPEIMEKKIKSITELINEKFGFIPASHRAGRWAMNDEYFHLLHKYGYKIDCSYTPGINWKKSRGRTPYFDGPDYSEVDNKPQMIGGILEMPVTVRNTHRLFLDERISISNIGRFIYRAIRGKNVWLRPNGTNLRTMQWLVETCYQSEEDYLMFMIHSSELMPGGSPKFQSEEDIENLYLHLNTIFQRISRNYIGVTLQEYYDTFCV